MTPTPAPRPPVLLGYLLHAAPDFGVLDADLQLALAREPGHVLVLVRREGAHRAVCTRCLQEFPTDVISNVMRGLVPYDSACAFDIRGRVIDHNRVILVVQCQVCKTRQQAAPDGAMFKHLTGPPGGVCQPMPAIEPVHLAMNAALAAVQSAVADYYPTGDDQLSEPAARMLVAHAAQISVVVALEAIAARPFAAVTDDGHLVDEAPDVDETVARFLAFVRERVAPIITRQRCEIAAAAGPGSVGELVDAALVLAVRLVVDQPNITAGENA